MTSEQRLDRLERIAKLFVRAGLRWRRQLNDQNQKIEILINAQIRHEEENARRSAELKEQVNLLIAAQKKNEELFARHDALFAKNDELRAKNDERFAKRDELFAKYDALFAENDERIKSSATVECGNGPPS